MQIQIVNQDPKGTTNLLVAEYKKSQSPVKFTVQAGQKISVVVDGVTLTGEQPVGSSAVRLIKDGRNLLIESLEDSEKLVELTNFYDEQDVLLVGDHWAMADGSQLQQLTEGVQVATTEPLGHLFAAESLAGVGMMQWAWTAVVANEFMRTNGSSHPATPAPNANPTPSANPVNRSLGAIAVVVPEAINSINAAEAISGGGVPVQVALPTNAAAGDVITVSIAGGAPVSYTVTAADVNPALNIGGTVSVLLSTNAITAAGQGAVDITTSYANAAGNPAAGGAVITHVNIDTRPPAPPALVLHEDTGNTSDFVSSNGTIDVTGLEVGATWQYSLDGGAHWQDGNSGNPAAGTTGSFVAATGNYAIGQVQVRQTDAAFNISDAGQLVHPQVVAATIQLDGLSGYDKQLQITDMADGGYVVTWHSFNYNNYTADVFVQRFGSDNVAQGSMHKLDGGRQDLNPQITAMADGGYVVSWAGGGMSGHDVFVQRFGSDNVAQGAPHQLHGLGGDNLEPQITDMADGGYVVTWNSMSQDFMTSDVFVQRFGSDNVAQGAPHQLNALGGLDQQVQITAMADGGYTVAWVGSDQTGQTRDVFVQRFGSDNVAQGAPHQLNALGGLGQQVQITAMADGGYMVAWQGFDQAGTNADVFVQRFGSNNVAQGAPHQLNTLNGDSPQITVMADGGYMVAWQGRDQTGTNTDVFVQRFGSNNEAQGGLHRLDGLGGADYLPAITDMADGSYVVIWKSFSSNNQSECVFVQHFGSDNVATQGGLHQLDAVGWQVDHRPQITAMADGGYTVAYTSNHGVTEGGGDMFVQRFDAHDHLWSSPVPLVVI